MRIFQWRLGRIIPGLQVRFYKNAVLAHFGQAKKPNSESGAELQLATIDLINPPEILDGIVYEADVVAPYKTDMSWMLTEAVDPSRKILARVNTKWHAYPNAAGLCVVSDGSPELLVSGTGVTIESAGNSTWSDVLYLMKPGDALTIIPQGSAISGTWSLWHDGVALSTARHGCGQTSSFDAAYFMQPAA